MPLQGQQFRHSSLYSSEDSPPLILPSQAGRGGTTLNTRSTGQDTPIRSNYQLLTDVGNPIAHSHTILQCVTCGTCAHIIATNRG